jgi:methanogenic corrinoid protein MtbC1
VAADERIDTDHRAGDHRAADQHPTGPAPTGPRVVDPDRRTTRPEPAHDGTPLSLTEAAERLGVHYMTAYRYVRTGMLAARQRSGQWEVAPGAVADLLAAKGAAARRGRATRPGTGAPGPARRVDALVDRLVAGDEAGAWRLVDDAFAHGWDHRTVYLTLLGPALRTIGDRWEAGTLTVGDEHLATVVATRLIGRAGARAARPGRPAGTVVLAAPAGDRHGLPSALVADLLRADGWRVIDLGPDAPADSLATIARAEDDLVGVGLCATTPLNPAARSRLRRAIDLLHAEVDRPVLLGGAAVPTEDDARRLGADAWAATADDVLTWVRAR